MSKVDIKKIEEILSRGVGEFIDPDGSFKAKLIKKQKGEYKKDIIIKFGVDPTRPDIHLGHAVVFRKLRQLQELGCKVIFLIGDFTAQIGDPTGKSKVRPEIELKEVENNMNTYLEQIDKILLVGKENSNVFDWIRNSDWFISMGDVMLPQGAPIQYTHGDQHISLPRDTYMAKTVEWERTRMMGKIEASRIYGVSFLTFLGTLRQITHARLLERDMFQERIKKGDQLYMHEMMYPVLQGLDSHVLALIYGSCDLEVGGTDQTFNMLMGRDVMKICKQERQAVLSFTLLEGLDGKEKMSKSLDNYIAINDSPEEMYGKIMSLPDNLIIKYFELATDVSLEEIKKYESDLKKGKNPRDIKMDLAFAVTSLYHGKDGASKGAEHFHTVFQQKEKPKDIIEMRLSATTTVGMVLADAGLVSSKSEANRLAEQGGIRKNDKEVTNINELVKSGDIIQKGKRGFIKIK